MKHVKDMTGQRFGRLVVLSQAGLDERREALWLCRCDCGTEKVLKRQHLRRARTKSCGCLRRERTRRSTDHPAWRGGRGQNTEGYIIIREPNHPAAQPNGYVFEHRLVMQKILGRPLRPEEMVHHKNGVRHDNRPENLELWSRGHPPGQRAEDLVVWAKEVLALYC